jgi:hypothetical protein
METWNPAIEILIELDHLIDILIYHGILIMAQILENDREPNQKRENPHKNLKAFI